MSKANLSDKVIVVTGASSGFGRGAALALAERGAALVLAARRTQLLEELANLCRNNGGRAIAIPTDVGLSDDVARLANAAIEEFGRFDVWVNDAGVAALGRFADVPIDDHRQVVLTNLVGVINGCWHALRHFRDHARGTLINIASALGKMPAPYYGSYVASKFGVVGLGGALRQELALAKLKGIRVCTVMPMSHDTPLFEHVANYSGHEVQPIPPLYDEQRVIDTIVRLVTHPKDEVIVGRTGRVLNAAHGVLRRPVDKLMARNSHRAMIKKSPPAPDRRGNLVAPVMRGSGVSGGRKRRGRRAARARTT